MNFNSLVIKQKQTNKNIYEDWVSKLNCKTEYFVPYDGHQNCLDKTQIIGIIGDKIKETGKSLNNCNYLKNYCNSHRSDGSAILNSPNPIESQAIAT